MLIIIRGLPGAGKSTMARHLAETRNLHHIEPDQYHEAIGGFDMKNMDDAHDWSRDAVNAALQAGIDTVVTSTFATWNSVKRYIDFARAAGTEWEVWKAAGEYGSVHDVPESMVESLRSSWEDIPGEIVFGA